MAEGSVKIIFETEGAEKVSAAMDALAQRAESASSTLPAASEKTADNLARGAQNVAKAEASAKKITAEAEKTAAAYGKAKAPAGGASSSAVIGASAPGGLSGGVVAAGGGVAGRAGGALGGKLGSVAGAFTKLFGVVNKVVGVISKVIGVVTRVLGIIGIVIGVFQALSWVIKKITGVSIWDHLTGAVSDAAKKIEEMARASARFIAQLKEFGGRRRDNDRKKDFFDSSIEREELGDIRRDLAQNGSVEDVNKEITRADRELRSIGAELDHARTAAQIALDEYKKNRETEIDENFKAAARADGVDPDSAEVDDWVKSDPEGMKAKAALDFAYKELWGEDGRGGILAEKAADAEASLLPLVLRQGNLKTHLSGLRENVLPEVRKRENEALKKEIAEIDARTAANNFNAELGEIDRLPPEARRQRLVDGGVLDRVTKRAQEAQAQRDKAAAAYEEGKATAMPLQELKKLAEAAEKAAETFNAAQQDMFTVQDMVTAANKDVEAIAKLEKEKAETEGSLGERLFKGISWEGSSTSMGRTGLWTSTFRTNALDAINETSKDIADTVERISDQIAEMKQGAFAM